MIATYLCDDNERSVVNRNAYLIYISDSQCGPLAAKWGVRSYFETYIKYFGVNNEEQTKIGSKL